MAHFRQRPVDISKEKIQLDIDIFKTQVISIIQNTKNTDELKSDSKGLGQTF